MRKLSLALCIGMFLSCFAFSAFATENTDLMFWSERNDLSVSGGYPRMAQRADGTLLLTTGGGNIYHSTDKGESWTKQIPRAIDSASNTAEVTKDGNTYSFTGLTRANLQPFVVSDGTVLLGYRCHTNTSSDEYASNGYFYTSIRVLTSIDGGCTFDSESEEILVEEANLTTTNGFWEPFFVQVDKNTVLCYYADDLNVSSLGSQQRIAYVEYDVATKTWDKTPKVAYYRTSTDGKIDSRDGMPMITQLIDGTYAMVLEIHDFAFDKKVVTNTGIAALLSPAYADCPFVVGLLLSKDGRTWTDPVPVFAPTSLTAGYRCSAPSIATLPDGRIIITCQTDETYVGYNGSNADNECVMAVAISDTAITNSTALTAIEPTSPKADGTAEGFTRLNDVMTCEENEYSIWNSVFGFGNDIYLLGGAAKNTSENITESGSGHVHFRRLTAFANTNEVASYNDAVARAGDNGFAAIYGTAENGTVTLGLPAGMTTANVYRMDGGRFLTVMDATVADGAIIFADNGGYYAVSDVELVTYGDSTADGKIGLADLLRIIKYTVNNSITIDIAASDMDASLSIDVKDAIKLIQNIIK